jgi:UDP-glucose 4-epimerase
MRTLITGGAGFIGSHLAEHLLCQGDEVILLDDLSTGTMQNLSAVSAELPLTVVVGSVLDQPLVQRAVARCDRVFHLAAAVGTRLVVTHPLQSLRTNLHGTENVLEAANDYRKPVLLASTGEVYGKNSADRLAEDSDRILGPVPSPRWTHAAVQAIDEALGYAYHREYGLPVTVARLFNTVGPRQRGWYGMVLPSLVEQALRDEPITVFGDGEQTRCFADVTDIVPALAQLADSPAALGQAVNLGGVEVISINGLAKRVVAVLSSASPIVHLPYDRGYGPGFEDRRRGVPDTSLATRLVGFDPQTGLDQMILQVADWLMACGVLSPAATGAERTGLIA